MSGHLTLGHLTLGHLTLGGQLTLGQLTLGQDFFFKNDSKKKRKEFKKTQKK